jgi:hypothetical protein
MLEFLENTDYEVLTKDGFKDFKGISTDKKECLRLTLENDEYIELTPDHKIIVNGKKIETKDFKIGDCVDYKNELVKIKNIETVGTKNVCDLISVKDNNSFWCNNINISNCLLIDEAAFVPQHIWDDFYMSVYPTISSGKKSKIIMVSTPNGMNHYYDMYRLAAKGETNFKAIKIPWSERPDRDEKWAEEMKKDVGAKRFAQEFQCKFLGASNTLVDGDVLERIEQKQPIGEKYSFAMLEYEKPIPGAFYILGVDSAKGNGADYSVIQVLKINNQYDIEQVATYRCNTVPIDEFVKVCIGISNYYNEAYMMVENNDIGSLVCEKIWYDYECDRIINVDKKGLGVRATRKTKFDGNMLLQRYIDNEFLKLNDSRTIYELSRYEEVSPNVFHAAGQNENDDCVTSLLWALFYITTEFYDPDEKGVKEKKPKITENEEMPNFLSENYDDNDWGFLNGIK